MNIPDFFTKPVLGSLVIVVLGLMVLLPGTSTLPLLDRDEPRFAQATVEMMERDEWIIPYFNGKYRFDKPILTYWLMRSGYALFGVGELGARFHSIVSTLLTALTLFWAGRRWFSPLAGFTAAFGFLTCFQILINGRSCTADMILVFTVTCSQLALCELLRNKENSRSHYWRLLLYLSLGGGFLAKGPIAIMVPLLSVILFRFVCWRKPLQWQNIKTIRGTALTLTIIASWGVPALIFTQGQFWEQGMNEHVVRRGLEIFNGRFYLPIFYLVTVFFSLFPWIAFSGCIIRHLLCYRSFEQLYCLCWFVSPIIIFTFYATQLPHYIMPGFGGFLLLLGHTVDLYRKPSVKRDGQTQPQLNCLIYRIVISLYVLLISMLLLVQIILPWKDPFHSLRLCLFGLLGLTATLVLLAWLVRHQKLFLLPLIAVFVGCNMALIGTTLNHLSPAVQLEPLFQQMSSRATYMAQGYTEGSMVFYSNGRWENIRDFKQLESFLQTGHDAGPRLAVVLEKETRLEDFMRYTWNRWFGVPTQLKKKDHTSHLQNLDTSGYEEKSVMGLNLGNSTWVELRVYYQIS